MICHLLYSCKKAGETLLPPIKSTKLQEQKTATFTVSGKKRASGRSVEILAFQL
ncbi:hypothetical protein HMPREF0262_02501 [Clostridium sp. ATCC 29733]|nr:hypothetical protein HMPREF0262_02501 [Clostridium sp. ATCC 29733]